MPYGRLRSVMTPLDLAWSVLKEERSPYEEGMRRVQERRARGFLMHGANSPMPRSEGRGRSEFGQDILEHHPLAGMAGYTPQPSNRYDVLDERETAGRAQASFDPESGELPDDLKPPNFQRMPPAIGQRGRLYDPMFQGQ